MEKLFFLAQGKIHVAEQGQPRQLQSEAVEKYRQNLQEINRRKEWKTSGQGAAFMGAATELPDPETTSAQVTSCVLLTPDQLIYAANLESACGLYIKNPLEPEEAERFIVRKIDTRLYELDCAPDGTIIVSASEGGAEQHLALCHAERADFDIITEGDSRDIMPSFSWRNRNIIYFSSSGLYFDEAKQTVHASSYSLNKLNLSNGEITELLADDTYDFLRGKEGPDGSLYCLRRERKQPKSGVTAKDILLLPYRLFKALFSWLNFFSQRYTGESLLKKTSGTNPAKNKTKTDEEIFIEGNLVNVSKTLKENAQQGEKYPGIAPKSWELMRLDTAGNLESVKKGILDYCFDAQQALLYSNGKYIVRRQPTGEEEIVCEARLATNLCPVVEE